MEWANLYHADRQPSDAEISDYVGNPLWGEFNAYLQAEYGVKPQPSYSKCTM